MLQLTAVSYTRRLDMLPFLLMADESEDVVKDYLYKGEIFEIILHDEMIGVMQFIAAQDAVELKNFSIIEKYRGKGYGKIALKIAEQLMQPRFPKIIVGTANSSIDNIAFYQKCGYELMTLRKDFFRHYPEPIFENGIQALHMLVFEKIIGGTYEHR